MARSDAFVHGYVVGIAVSSRGDGDDTNALPDVAPAPVQITFTRRRGQYTQPLPAPDAGAHGMFVLHDRVVCGVIPSGEHVGHLTSDLTDGKATADSTPGVWLVTGQYRVSAAGHFPEFDINVTAEHTPETPLDLYSAVPYVPPPEADVQLVPLPPGGVPGQYLTPLPGGGYGWATPSGGGGALEDATTTTKGIVQLAGDLAGTADAPTVPGLADKADASHTHNASDVNAGTLAIARIPTGTTSSTVALGNHTHTPASIGAAPASHTHGAADLSGVVKTVNGTAPDGAGNVTVEGGGGGAVSKTRLIGRWHGPLISGRASDGAVMGAGVLWCSPSWSSGETYDAIWHRSTITDAAGTLRLGLYAVGSDGLPSTLLWGSPALSGAVDHNRVVTFDEPLVVPAGPYFAVAVTDSATLKAYIFKGAALDRNWVGASGPDWEPSRGITIPNYDATAPLPTTAVTTGWSVVEQPVAVVLRRPA